jgi:hypothetical protein
MPCCIEAVDGNAKIFKRRCFVDAMNRVAPQGQPICSKLEEFDGISPEVESWRHRCVFFQTNPVASTEVVRGLSNFFAWVIGASFTTLCEFTGDD